MLISDKKRFQSTESYQDKERHYTMIKVNSYQEDTAILNLYTPEYRLEDNQNGKLTEQKTKEKIHNYIWSLQHFSLDSQQNNNKIK